MKYILGNTSNIFLILEIWNHMKNKPIHLIIFINTTNHRWNLMDKLLAKDTFPSNTLTFLDKPSTFPTLQPTQKLNP